MNFLLDTNVISEWVKPRPNMGVVTWLSECDEDRVFISVVSIAEIRNGVERMVTGARRTFLDRWLENELPMRFEGRLLDVDAAVADVWGRLTAHRQTAGRPIGPMDACIAAIARRHKLTLVTRNTADFEALPISIINPFL